MGIFSSLFGGHADETANTTTSSTNTSNTTNSVDSHNVANNTTVNSTSNSTDTLTQDRRMVVDNGGYGVSADNSTIITSNSNNSSVRSSDNHATYNTMTDFGVLGGVVAANKDLAMHTIDVSKVLTQGGQDMVKANFDFLEHIFDSSQGQTSAAIGAVQNASKQAMEQVAAIAAKPLNANDPQRLVILVGLAVVGIAIFTRK
jgi:hypothetical protein